MSEVSGRTLVNQFEQFAPKSIAMGKDPVGLHFGNLDQPVKKVMVTLDVRPEVIEEAVEQSVNFIFSHHPPIFKAIKSFNTEDPQIKMYENIIKHDITIYAAHTNLDVAEGGMNDWLADALNLQNVEPLTITQDDENGTYGLGRIGNLNDPISLEDFFDTIKSTFQVEHLRYISNDVKQTINRVAVLGGDGGDSYTEALDKGADVLVTGDVYYHTAHDMLAAGLSVIDPGHHIESIVKPRMKTIFEQWAKENGWELEFIESAINTDPFNFI